MMCADVRSRALLWYPHMYTMGSSFTFFFKTSHFDNFFFGAEGATGTLRTSEAICFVDKMLWLSQRCAAGKQEPSGQGSRRTQLARTPACSWIQESTEEQAIQALLRCMAAYGIMLRRSKALIMSGSGGQSVRISPGYAFGSSCTSGQPLGPPQSRPQAHCTFADGPELDSLGSVGGRKASIDRCGHLLA